MARGVRPRITPGAGEFSGGQLPLILVNKGLTARLNFASEHGVVRVFASGLMETPARAQASAVGSPESVPGSAKRQGGEPPELGGAVQVIHKKFVRD